MRCMVFSKNGEEYEDFPHFIKKMEDQEAKFGFQRKSDIPTV